MCRKWKFILLFVLCYSVGFSQTTKPKSTVKTPQYIMHVVKFGETLTKIAKNYGVTVVSILNINPSLTEDNLNPEQILRIPNTGNKKTLTTSNTDNNELQPKVANKQELTPKTKYHVVLQGQTLYSISKMYNVKVEDLQKWNDLKDFNVKVGSLLLIESNSSLKNDLPATKPESLVNIPSNKSTAKQDDLKVVNKPQPAISANESVKPQIDTFNTGVEKPDIQASDNASQKELLKIYKEKSIGRNLQSTKGTGAPMTTTLGAMENVYFAMHKSLPIGTILKIKNLVNNKIIYAKVIGKLPETDENKHVIVRYSLGVKKDLQLQNGKCYVQIEYPD